MYKIVQMVPALGWGGAQIFCIQLCNELANYPGYDVTLVNMYHHKPEKHLPLDLIDPKVKFITLGKHKGIDLKMFGKLNSLLKKLQPDVVHTHLHTSYYCFFAYLTAGGNYKKFHTFHSMVKTDSPWHGRLAYKYFFGKGIIHPVSISEEVFKSAQEEYGHGVIKTLINNGTMPITPSPLFNEVKAIVEKLKKDSNTKVLLNVARINKLKNQELLLNAMRKLEEEGANVISIVLGDHTPDEQDLYNHLMKIKPGNVHFLGKVKNVRDYYLNSDAFVLTSKFEGLPISLLEALSAGCIPVCTPAGGVVNIVKNDIGFLSADIGYESYFASLKSYLNSSKEQLDILRANGKKLYSEQFSMQRCASFYNELYHN